MLADVFINCCAQVLKLHEITRCVGGDQLNASYTFTGLLERDQGLTQSGNNQTNTTTSVAYIKGDESWVPSLDYNATGHFIEYVLPNGKSEWYRVERFIEGRDFDCCDIDHYELELSRVRKPALCP